MKENSYCKVRKYLSCLVRALSEAKGMVTNMGKSKKENPDNEQKASKDPICENLEALRESNNNNRWGRIKAILFDLGHPDTNSIPETKLDAFLIKVADEVFEDDYFHRDIVLMVLGLLEGFEWNKYIYRVRQKSFLSKTYYLEYKRITTIIDFDVADEEEQKRAINALEKVERSQLNKIYEGLLRIKKDNENNKPAYFEEYVKNINCHSKRDNNGDILSIKYPEPTYLKPPKKAIDYLRQIFIELKKINNRTNYIDSILKKIKTSAVKNALIFILLCIAFLGGLAKYSSHFFSLPANEQSNNNDIGRFQDEKNLFDKNNFDESLETSNTDRHLITVARGTQTISSDDFNTLPK